MGFFSRRKQIVCPRETWTTLISNFGSGMPRTWEIVFTAQPGFAVAGVFREQRALWVFQQTPVEGPLAPTMFFHRKWINAIYSLRVYPTSDLVAEFE